MPDTELCRGQAYLFLVHELLLQLTDDLPRLFLTQQKVLLHQNKKPGSANWATACSVKLQGKSNSVNFRAATAIDKHNILQQKVLTLEIAARKWP